MSSAQKEQQTQVPTTMSPPIHIPDSFKGYPISSFNLQHVPACDLESVLIPGGLVRDRIERLGFDISTDFAHEDFTFLCVLKGGFQFFNQLLEVVRQYQRFNIDQSVANDKTNCKARRIQAEFIRLISYEDDASRGDVRIIGLENLSSLRNKNVLIVEDIIDSGLTMQTLLKALNREQPRLIRVASLFFKRTPKNTGKYYPDYVGFSIPDSFIVGCNLDYNNYFRDLQHVCVISNEAYHTGMCSNEGSQKRENVLVLFDVDGTITPARQDISQEMHQQLQKLRQKVKVGLVGGSDLDKIAAQTLPPHLRSAGGVSPIDTCVSNFDYVFAENGLVAYKDGHLLAKQSLVHHLGEERIQRFINFCLGYMSKLTLPVKRGNFIEFRNGLINVCPVGRSCSQEERQQFNAYDDEHKIRRKFIEELEKQFGPNSSDPLGLVFTIGGQISFDVFPRGWDKTFCLSMIDPSFDKVYFFGDKTQEGGNDHEIFMDSRTIGRTVKDSSDTLKQLMSLGLLNVT